MPTLTQPGVRRFQHGVTALLLIVFAVPLCWMVGSWLESRRQQRVAARIEELGGQVTWGGDGVGFTRLAGGYVQRVNLNQTHATDEDFAELMDLTELETLRADGTPLTGKGLAHLQGLSNLVQLHLGHTKITDEGLRYVGNLHGLKFLNLQATQIGDAGVAHLRNLTNMEGLDLSDTQITDDALAHLTSMERLKRLVLERTQITDRGLEQLGKMTTPDAEVELDGTGVSKAGVAALKKEAPNWRVSGY